MRPSKHEIEIVNKLRGRGKLTDHQVASFMSLADIYYFVDNDKKFTTCVIITGRTVCAGATKRVTHRGWKPDEYSEQTGRNIAFSRAIVAEPQIEMAFAESAYTSTGFDVRMATEVVGTI